MWDELDKQGFEDANNKNIGQFHDQERAMQIFETYAKNPMLQNYLEVGTWNGRGSTAGFAKGFRQRHDNAWVFYSLEANKEKQASAADLYKDDKNIHILHSVLDKPYEHQIKAIFKHVNGHWNQVDNDNVRTATNFWDMKDIPKWFDVVMLDGGEYTTYFDFLTVRDKTGIMILDDVNDTKSHMICQLLNLDPMWKLIECVKDQRGNDKLCVYENVLGRRC